MSRTFHHGERRIRVRGVRKDPPDLRRLARALIELVELQAEVEAEAEHNKRIPKQKPRRKGNQDAKASDTRRGDAA